MLEFIKRINWRIAAPLLFFVCVFFSWFLGWRGYQALHAVPEQSALTLLFDSPDQYTSTFSGHAKILSGLTLLQVCRADLDQALQVFRTHPAIQKSMGEGPLVAAFSLHPNDSLHPVFVFEASNTIDLNRLLNSVADSIQVSTSIFKGHTIYNLQVAGREQFVVAAIRNLVLVSRFSYLVEEALLQAPKRNGWWKNQANMLEAPFRAVVRPEKLAERSKGKLAPDWAYLPDLFSAAMESVAVGFDGKQWQVAARTRVRDAGQPYEKMPRQNIAAVLPDHTALLTWVGSKRPGALVEFADAKEKDADFQHFVAPWVGKEAAFVLTEPYSNGMREDQFWVCAVRDEALARKRLDAYGERTGVLRRYEYQTYEIRQFLSRSLLEPLFDAGQQGFQNPVCVLLEGYAVFAASPSALELWIDKYIVSQTLANNPDYLLLNQELPDQSSRFYFGNATHFGMLLKQLCAPDFFVDNAADIALAQNSGLYGLDLQYRRLGEWSGTLFNRTATVSAPAASLQWKTALGSSAITQPYFIPAAGPDREGAILIQDARFQLYRLSPGGNIVWRKQLDQPLLSAVQGIDFFGNGGVCYLFNTADALWVIDDEGKEVVGYPLRLQSPATNGVVAVDFHENRNYSLFVACTNGNLYGFDQYGRPLAGWNPKQGVGRVKHPLIHFKNETRDFLVVLSLDGQLSVFNRDGAPHFDAVHFEGSFFANPPQFDNSPESARIVCLNAAGQAYSCNLRGEFFRLDLHITSKSEHFFVLDTLFGDQRRDYAVLSDKVLYVSGYVGKSFQKKSAITFPAPQDTLFTTGQPGRLGTLDREKRQIFMVTGTGKLLPGFPLAGTTPFAIGNFSAGSSGALLLVGNGAEVYAYRVSG